ncbi:MAG: hypothetical protein GKS06_15675 [Acidobacteria bacterium]|nr:hypothetical protein [Acidobacteriota bacterium]
MPKKSFARVALIALLAATLVVAPVSKEAAAQSASGATAFSISFPNVVVLHYWSQLNMAISTNDLTSLLIGNTSGDSDEGTAPASGTISITDNSGTLEADANISYSSATDVSDITLHIQNAWAVRAVGGSGEEVQMSFTASSSSLSGPTGNSIDVNNYFVGASGGSAPSSSTYNFTPPGLVNPEVGDIALELDMTDAEESGNYTGSWTLQAEIV